MRRLLRRLFGRCQDCGGPLALFHGEVICHRWIFGGLCATESEEKNG